MIKIKTGNVDKAIINHPYFDGLYTIHSWPNYIRFIKHHHQYDTSLPHDFPIHKPIVQNKPTIEPIIQPLWKEV